MKICVLNGSPKGPDSVTMQYIAYWRQQFPEHAFDIIHASRQCPRIEKNLAFFDETIARVRQADFIVWAFPLYFLLVHSNYMRFIELIFERRREDAFQGKPAISLSTSIHFFDHTAHFYIRSICDDLGLNYIDFLPAHMHDLLDDQRRSSLDALFGRWIRQAQLNLSVPRAYPVEPTASSTVETVASSTAEPASSSAGGVCFTYQPAGAVQPLPTEKKVCIVVDDGWSGPDARAREDEGRNGQNLKAMVARMLEYFPQADVVDLRTIKMGPCLGCLKCGPDNICAYEGKDDFIDLYRNVVLKADIILFAGSIHRRYFSSSWQRYLERSFNRTHQPVLEGKQVAFLVSGPLRFNPHMREVLQAYTENMRANLVDIITDEAGATDYFSDHSSRIDTDYARSAHIDATPLRSAAIDARLDFLARTLVEYADRSVMKPVSFLGVAGMKIFRDEIFEQLKFVFQADHKYYRKHGMYDFPQKKPIKRIVFVPLMLLSKIPFVRKRIRAKLKSRLTVPYRKVLQPHLESTGKIR